MIGRDSSFMVKMFLPVSPGSAVRRSVYAHAPCTRGHVKIAVTRLDVGCGYRQCQASARNQYDLDDESHDDGEPTPSVGGRAVGGG